MNEFSLPATNYDVIEKVIMSYSNQKKPVTNEDIAQISGLPEHQVSRNNKFLVENGLIEGGKTKSVTDIGSRLGRALQHGKSDIVSDILKEIISANESLSELITYVRLQKNLDKDKFADHILYCSGQATNQYSKAGAKCIVDIFFSSGILEENEGTLKVLSSKEREEKMEISNEEKKTIDLSQAQVNEVAIKEADNIDPKRVIYNPNPSISINIQLHLPESNDPEIYNNIFSALRRNLIDGKE
ncbi:hypothetical protein QE109_02250 [Fusibacter bizertensis]|uniref:DUF5343 domain-containing protein n=1 Tax=Fusibacter bizertensis TaxID=1488331 RepID=A0ABT6N967_9FIRM|nr:hypothetical protein [Fusibacter bizertensis]MDH8676948.1 hypothetical protein [Fusibacter bizertensis]